MTDKRIPWIDAFKGFAMICVIMSHMQIPKVVVQFCFAFHMPLFFFASGYLYGDRKPSLAWVLRKIDGLIVPYFIYSGLLCCMMPFTLGCSLESIIASIYEFRGLGFTWFFVCLFFAEMIGAIILRCVGRGSVRMLTAVLGSAVVGCVLEHASIRNLCMIRCLFQATAFWLAGAWVRESRLLERILALPSRRLVPVIFPMVALAALFPMNFRWESCIDMSSCKTGNPFLFYGTGLSIVILLALFFNRFLTANPMLKYVGQRSLLFLAMSQFVPPLFRLAMASCGYDSESGVVIKSIQRVITLALVVGGVWLCDKNLPIMAGKVKVFSRTRGL